MRRRRHRCVGLIGRRPHPPPDRGGPRPACRSPRPGDVWDPDAGIDRPSRLGGLRRRRAPRRRRHRRRPLDRRAEARASATAARSAPASSPGRLAELDDGPRILVSGSAIGWYGDTGDRLVDEGEPAGDRLRGVDRAGLGGRRSARGRRRASASRSCRTAQVLSTDGGLARQAAAVLQVGLGGKVGLGPPVDDAGSASTTRSAPSSGCLTPRSPGPVNLVSPEPVTQRRLRRSLGRPPPTDHDHPDDRAAPARRPRARRRRC